MKQSDIEEIKAILWTSVGVFANSNDLIAIALGAWLFAALSLAAACVASYYERKIIKLMHTLDQLRREK